MSEIREEEKKETQENNFTYSKTKINTIWSSIKLKSLDFIVFPLVTMTTQWMGNVIIKKQTNKN